MWRYRLNPTHWPINTKLTMVFLVAVLLPTLIILVPFSGYRRNALVREQYEARLETLGPFEIARTEQTLQTLVTQLERLFADPADYDPVEEYLFAASNPTAEAELDRYRAIARNKVEQFVGVATSLSRVRLFDANATLLLDATAEDGALTAVTDDLARDAMTPANELIRSEQLATWATVGPIYPDTAGQPVIDAIFVFRPAWDTSGVGPASGYVVFTQDLTRAANDDMLPDLFGALQAFPRTSEETHIFLLDEAGRVVSTTDEVALFSDAGTSRGFLQAERGAINTATYFSPLLGTEVLGYYQAVGFTNGPEITFLVETPMDEINSRVLREALLTLVLVGGGVLILGVLAIYVGSLWITRPMADLTERAREIAAGRLDARLPVLARRDEIGVLNNTLSGLADQLLVAIQELELRVAERTRNLEITLEIGRVLSSIHDLDLLLERVVNLIREQFDTIYHAQIFLIDPQTNRAMLRVSTGAVGRELLQRGHYLEVGSQSVIGSVTASGHAVVALDTSTNPVHRRNEFLPETRAEMALPLRIGDRVIGALDLQSRLPDGFREQDVELFQGMADQITIAIENATLFEESRARLREIERLNQALTRAGWRDVEKQYATRQALMAVAGTLDGGGADWTVLQRQAMQTREIAEQVDGETVTFAVPVVLRGEIVGAVEWQVPRSRYTQDVRRTAQDLSTRLALSAENVRLSEQSRRAAHREFLVNQISSKLTGTTDVDEILRIAVRELGLVLRVPQAAIRLVTPSDDGDSEPPPDAASE
jgi:GAF domain-containing protein/HAMP domain-containing protein